MSRSKPKLVAILAAMALLVPGVVILSEAPSASAAPAYGRVSVSGADITVNGDPSAKFFGVVDTTALQFAIMAYINGDMSVAGKTSVFNGPDTGSNSRMSQNANPEEFWHQYFALLSYYNCNLVRIGAGDTWGTDLQYKAWLNHRAEFLNLLDVMLDEAYEHGVWVTLVLAGSQAEPEAPYKFGGSGSAFVPGNDAYNRYIAYSKDVMAALEGYNSLGWYDLWNEPDHDRVYANYWQSNGGKVAFNNWAKAVASATAGVSTHPRTLGVAGFGAMFGMTQQDFDLSTGKTGFEIAHRHYYASANDANNFNLPEQWAKNDGLPLFWGELAYNAVYPLTRWTFGEQAIWSAGGQAITSMVLTGTQGYPYTGGTLPDPVNPPAPPNPTVPQLSITSSPGTSATYGTAYSYKVITSETASVTVTTNAPFLDFDASSVTVSGTPDEVGTYAVSITATASDGRTATQEYTLMVSGDPTAGEPDGTDDPADLPKIVATALSSTEYEFSYPLENIATIEWDFGDGTTSSEVTARHAFQVGEHVVTVSATDSSGREYKTSMDVVITPNIGDGRSHSAGYVLGGSGDSTFLVIVLAGLVLAALGCIHIFGGVYRRR